MLIDRQAYDFIEKMQFRHWWFRGRSKVIDSFLRTHSKNKATTNILEIGSGFGALLPVLTQAGSVDLVEPYRRAYPSLRKAEVNKIYDIDNFPFKYPKKKYDIVCLFDVLEHIKADQETLKVIQKKLLKKNGKCLFTVPAFMWLYSRHDQTHGHYKRYDRTSIKKMLKLAGYKKIRISYFMTLLFPLAVIERTLEKHRAKDASMRVPGSMLNTLFYLIFSLESVFIGKINFPYGLSIIVMAEK